MQNSQTVPDPEISLLPVPRLIQMCEAWLTSRRPTRFLVFFCAWCETCGEAISVREPFTAYERLECDACGQIMEYRRGWLRISFNPEGRTLIHDQEGLERVQEFMRHWTAGAKDGD